LPCQGDFLAGFTFVGIHDFDIPLSGGDTLVCHDALYGADVRPCSYDNFEEPKATLTGKAIYDGEAVGVRSGSSEFALFQDVNQNFPAILIPAFLNLHP
jgi:hypothetical protein